MAAYGGRLEKHAFRRISDDIRDREVPGLVLLCGSEAYLIEWARELLSERFTNDAARPLDLAVFEEGTYSFEDIKEACETLPVLSEKKVVVAENLEAVWGKGEKWFSKEDRKSLGEYAADVPDSTMLIITAPGSLKDNKKYSHLTDVIRKNGRIYEFTSLNDRDLKGFIAKTMKQRGKSMSVDTMDMLISESGYMNNDIDYGLYNLLNDLKKAMDLSEGEVVGAEAVAESISGNLEHNVFKMLDAVSQDNKEEAFRRLHEMLVSGEPAPKLLATIANHLELMLQVREMDKEGRSVQQMKSALNVHEFRIKKAKNFAARYSAEELCRILERAFKADTDIKTGLLNEELALEMLVAEI